MTNSSRHEWRTCRVTESTMVTPRARRITLKRPESLGKPADPGSHVDVEVVLPNGTKDTRSYSIVESDRAGAELSITVQLADRSRGGSAYMHRLEVGDTVTATRPLQDFPVVPGADSYVLLAGGIGVTALVGAARLLARMGARYRIVYAGRSRQDMAYAELLQREHGDRLSVHVDDEDSSLDVAELVTTIADDSSRRTELLMCGPVRLMDAVRRAWAQAELSPVDLRFETFGNSGWFDAEDFEVTLPEQDLRVRVAPDQTILEALTAAGADVMWDCRKGECGLCLMEVTDLSGRLDHRDVFLSDPQKRTGDRLCMCVTRAVGDGAAPTSVALRTP